MPYTSVEIFPSVDFDKSVKRKRLAYKVTPRYIFDGIISWIFISFYVFIGLIPLIDTEPNGDHAPIWVMMIAALYLCWILLNIIFRNTLIKIEGANVMENRKNLLETMHVYYPKDTFVINNPNMIRSYRPLGKPFLGKIITIILVNELILINIGTLGKGNYPAFAYGFWNFLKAKRIARYYRKHYSG